MKFNLMDNVVTRALTKICDMICLNVIWLICCIPIVTIGASTTALYSVLLKMVKNEEGYIFRSFFKAFKENFRQSTVIWLLFVLVSVIWWVVIVAGIAIVTRMESTRRELVRNVYVADGRIYNSEAGTRSVTAGSSVVDSIAAVLASLSYDISKSDEGSDAAKRGNYRYVVRTFDYDESNWNGEVVVVATGNTVPFSSKAELARIVG